MGDSVPKRKQPINVSIKLLELIVREAKTKQVLP